MQQKAEPKRVRSLSFGIERLGLTALRYPVVAAVLVVAITIAAGFGYTRLKVDDVFRPNTAAEEEQGHVADDFGRGRDLDDVAKEEIDLGVEPGDFGPAVRDAHAGSLFA